MRSMMSQDRRSVHVKLGVSNRQRSSPFCWSTPERHALFPANIVLVVASRTAKAKGFVMTLCRSHCGHDAASTRNVG